MSLHGTGFNPRYFHRSQIKYYLILIPLSIFMVLPIIYVFSHSLKPMDELFAYPPKFFVRQPTLRNFEYLMDYVDTSGIPMTRYLFNGLVVSIIVVFVTLFISSLGAYVLSKHKFLGEKTLFEINTLALMFVPTAVMIPRYLIVDQLHLIDSFFVHIFPMIAMPIGLFLLKQFIDQIPNSLIEASKIDGASDFHIYRKIIIPLIRPALATVAILSFQAVWNSADTSTLYVNDESLKTFSFFMTTFVSISGNSVAGQGMAAAAALFMFLPNLIIFIIMQSKVMNTMAHSGIK